MSEIKLLERCKDVLIGLTGFFDEMGLEDKMPRELDDEVTDLLQDLDEELEKV